MWEPGGQSHRQQAERVSQGMGRSMWLAAEKGLRSGSYREVDSQDKPRKRRLTTRTFQQWGWLTASGGWAPATAVLGKEFLTTYLLLCGCPLLARAFRLW